MYIAIEWTSAAFRALLLNDKTVLGEKKSARGTTRVTNDTFEAALREELGDWLEKTEMILFSGMITSRNGWIESPFAPVPAGPADLADQAVTHHVEGLPPLVFLPGIAQTTPLPDVMRGEEMSLFGLTETEGLFVLPGPHAKWVTMEGGHISAITTYMSGEILDLLKKDSLVSRLIPATYEERPDAFRRGVLTACEQGVLPGRILARIFSARSLVLFDELGPEEIADYLAGLMIGAEIAEALGEGKSGKISIVGHTPLAGRYKTALELFGAEANLVTPDIAAGFRRVASRQGDAARAIEEAKIAPGGI
ncbi:2-dehydro-3-deoxygalactonokinase [Rhizobium petrolearium]|uniref:2-dehydro-3-deoxygalactonokinase n=1 Tax=Neorhizobium petrolearium TaxID=515361 RepID=UPI001AEA6270|nr:2-dehydro-3-deoxygalactonokinase [Neorhizobium petrolearium]MBP1844838.1 2-dehydro-3-deoxygalactonokinase [Neorhizobium petrolearium]